MGEITLKCKKRRKVLAIFHRESSESDKKDSKEEVVSCENYEDFIDDESVSEILKDVRSFDHLLHEHLEAI